MSEEENKGIARRYYREIMNEGNLAVPLTSYSLFLHIQIRFMVLRALNSW